MYNFLIGLSRTAKRRLVFGFDLALTPLAMILAFAMRYGMAWPAGPVGEALPVLVAVTLGAIPTLYLSGVSRIKIQNTEIVAVSLLAIVSAVLAALAVIASYMLRAPTPRSVPLIFGITYFVMTLGLRIFIVGLLASLRGAGGRQKTVIIYGAGTEGTQIASALRSSGHLRPVAFIDDNETLRGLQIAGLKVRGPSDLPRLIQRRGVDTVILALGRARSARRQEIVRALSPLGVEVQMLPSIAELLSRGEIGDKLLPVRPDELLGRDKVDLAVPEVALAYTGRVVMVTGAGGSIGSELCRQLVDCRPRRIVLYDHSEFLLYEIDRELRAVLPEGPGIEIRTRLGSVANPARVRSVMEDDGVELVLHAAAYKHVPLVEENELEGARNNVMGTRIVAEAAVAAGVERFVLVSTDKAVRPTNIMGATKRLAELAIQDMQTRSPGTRLAMVRFGNVLGSSGSVLPLFQRQIARGGPLTVTHPEVTRFFMTIPEAARLVLLAGAFAQGGDVFVLDMGEPVRILDIAHRMIELSGREPRSPEAPDGVEIRITGLRPGEKLYEELLIDDDTLMATPHEKILRAQEDRLSPEETAAMLAEVAAAIEAGDSAGLRAAVRRYVAGYHTPDPLPPPEDPPGPLPGSLPGAPSRP